MAAELGRSKFEAGPCMSLQDIQQQLVNLDNALGNPSTPTDATVPTVVYVVYDGVNFTDTAGNVISPTSSAISVYNATVLVSAAVTKLNFDGSAVTSITNDGGGQVTITLTDSGGTPTVNSFETITLGSYDPAINGSDPLIATSATDTFAINGSPGIQITTDGAAPKKLQVNLEYPYELYSGQCVGAIDNSMATITVDNVVNLNGATITATTADTITVRASPRMAAADNTVLYFMRAQGVSGGVDYTAGLMLNWVSILRGVADYNAAVPMLLGHKASGSDVPVWDEVYDWLKTLTGYNASNNQYLKNEAGTIKWVDASTC